jgi:hypothetical protein
LAHIALEPFVGKDSIVPAVAVSMFLVVGVPVLVAVLLVLNLGCLFFKIAIIIILLVIAFGIFDLV